MDQEAPWKQALSQRLFPGSIVFYFGWSYRKLTIWPGVREQRLFPGSIVFYFGWSYRTSLWWRWIRWIRVLSPGTNRSRVTDLILTFQTLDRQPWMEVMVCHTFGLTARFLPPDLWSSWSGGNSRTSGRWR